MVNGATSFVHDWGRSSEDWSEYVLLVLSTTAGSYILGGIGWMVLLGLRRPFRRTLSDWLDAKAGGNGVARSKSEAAAQDLRQRAIEECAEEAYEHVIENEAATAADHERAQRVAARLRDAILELGKKNH